MKPVTLAVPLCLTLNSCVAIPFGVAGAVLAGGAAGTTTIANAPSAGHTIHNIVTRKRGCRLVELWKCPVPGDWDF